jgi:ribosomal protein L30
VAKNASVLRIRQVRSTIGRNKKQREVLRTLGLRRIGHVVERPDNDAVRGAVLLVKHLVVIEDEGAKDAAPAKPAKAEAASAKADAAAAEKSAGKKTKKKAAKKKTAKKKTKKKTAKKKAAKKKTAKKKKTSGGKS